MKETLLIIATLMSFSRVYAQDWNEAEISQFIQGLNNGFEVDYSGLCLSEYQKVTDLSQMVDGRGGKCNMGDYSFSISNLEFSEKDKITNCHYMILSVDDLPLPTQIKLSINSQVSILPSNDGYFVRLSPGTDFEQGVPGGGNKSPTESSLLRNFRVKKGTDTEQCIKEVYDKYFSNKLTVGEVPVSSDSFDKLSYNQKASLHLGDICYLHSIYASSPTTTSSISGTMMTVTKTVDFRALETVIKDAIYSDPKKETIDLNNIASIKSALGAALSNHWSVIRNNALNPSTIASDPPIASLQTAFSEVYGEGNYIFLDEFERIFEIKDKDQHPEVTVEIVPLNQNQYYYHAIKKPAKVRFMGPFLTGSLGRCPSVNDNSRGGAKDSGASATDSSVTSGSTAVKE
jgi:hypothetical protein